MLNTFKNFFNSIAKKYNLLYNLIKLSYIGCGKMKRFLKALKATTKIMLIIYLIITILISAFIFIAVAQSSTEVTNELFVFYLIALLASFVMVTFFVGPFISWYLMIKLGNDVMDKIDGSEYKDLDNHIYFRDVPKDYNPAVASLILNKWFEKNTDITTMLLYFIKRGFLKKDGDNIVYTGKDLSILNQSEKYFVEGYANKKFVFEVWKDFIIQEAKDMGYVEEPVEMTQEQFKEKYSKVAIILFVGAIILFNILPDIITTLVVFSLSFLLIPFGIIFLLILGYRRGQINVKLTKKGIEEQEKLVKLRRYLTEFSSLEASGDDAIVLWEDYLIYAVALGVNNSIVENSKIYNKMNNGEFSINQRLAYELSQTNKD